MQAKCTCPGTDHEKALAQIANVIDLYRGKDGSLIQVLHLAQQIYGCLPLEVQMFISREMGIPLSEISGVVSFYSFFSTVPRGEHTIRVCLGTACYVRGGKRVLEGLMQRLGVELGGTTQDGKFTLEVARCIGACGLAPAMLIDDEVFKQVNVNKLESILTKF
ncbi:MAG: NAD(P)H-dependent oxidoreductase subunit E [Clostridiales bacterium]|jgi:NADH:ubiquinone oxidoreductase subunit E|nr:NAD(P)H-dependent oxidoreductase subunit E [Clostridiales bacterium]OPZ68205.1 MAG: NADP-reducing hydrogenase subunit HndA [Firmicutes bacterium ADurb.Bin467]